MKKIIVFLVLSCVLYGCSKPIIKEGTGTYRNHNGEISSAHIKVKNDKIIKVKIDESVKDKDKTKKELGSEFGMMQASPIKKEWYEQVVFFEKYVEKHGIDKIKVNVEGKAENNDVKSGCTIAVESFIKAIREAQKNAK